MLVTVTGSLPRSSLRRRIWRTLCPGYTSVKRGAWRTTMSLAAATLIRSDRRALNGLALLPIQPPTVRSISEDDDLLDEWLASLSVDEFEHILNGIAALS